MIEEKAEKIPIERFNYHLPDERIAKYPVEPRDSSKLLVYQDGEITESAYRELPKFLPSNTTLVVNNTKVIEARLLFRKDTGGIIEIFCLEHGPMYSDVTTAMSTCGAVDWFCQIGGAKKWKQGLLQLPFEYNRRQFVITAEKVEQIDGQFLIHFSWNNSELSFAEILHIVGNVPLPPYLNRGAESSDKERYQTVYAKHDGSVAAPTAGLHFTDSLMSNLKQKGIHFEHVTLHVGAGTFKPVKDEHIEDHLMHAEFIEVDQAFIANYLNALNGTLLVVGTTSLRTLESLYWMGVKIIHNKVISLEELAIEQWEAYELDQNFSNKEAFDALLEWMNVNQLHKLVSKTRIMIKPGYRIRTVDGILTNFHQPKSTLLLLIHAFVGNDWEKIYAYAMQHNFRFLSYGDGSLLWNKFKR